MIRKSKSFRTIFTVKTMVEWKITEGLTSYPDALAHMEKRVNAIIAGQAEEQVWLVEHPPMFTAGTSAKSQDLVAPDMFEVFESRRGGEYTYHGPGQRVAYAMLDLNKRGKDVRAYVGNLEEWVIKTLASFNVEAGRREGRVGVWVNRPERPALLSGQMAEDKIAAIGVRIRRWVTFHGISINVEPELSHYEGIVPCGIADYGVTSLTDLGILATMNDLDLALRQSFAEVFEN